MKIYFLTWKYLENYIPNQHYYITKSLANQGVFEYYLNFSAEYLLNAGSARDIELFSAEPNSI